MRFAVVPTVLLIAAACLVIPACQGDMAGTAVSGDMAGTAVSTHQVQPGSIGAQLFEANCAACHGATGRGDGIGAMALGVKPRDLWVEPLRYVSSTDGVATHEDLVQTIRFGRNGGEMPAAPWFTDEEAAAMGAYVREIQRQGWIDKLEMEFQGSDALSPEEIEEISWERVTAFEPITVPTPSVGFRPDSGLGRELFVQSCVSCHGTAGRGDGLDMPLDEQGKSIKARDLTRDPIRGGDSPEELFKRIYCGIPGTPMPAQLGYSGDEIWQLVYYTRTLMGRPIPSGSQP